MSLPMPECFEKRAVISETDTPLETTKKPSPGEKQAAGKPTLDELADGVATRLSSAVEEME